MLHPRSLIPRVVGLRCGTAQKEWKVASLCRLHLNDACPKDTFPLPWIDQIVDVTIGHKLLSFINAYSCYNPIPMFHSDLAKTTFIIPTGMYCYNVMPFGLKKARATYQRMMSRMFEPLLGKTMEVYINDMLVKS